MIELKMFKLNFKTKILLVIYASQLPCNSQSFHSRSTVPHLDRNVHVLEYIISFSQYTYITLI